MSILLLVVWLALAVTFGAIANRVANRADDR